MKMRKLILISLAPVLLLAGLGHYLVVDGRLPKTGMYPVPLRELRLLAQASPSQLPTAIEVEVIAQRQVPRFGTQAGVDGRPVIMARAVFRVRSLWGDTLIDVGMTDEMRQKFMPDDTFDAAAMARVERAIPAAQRIVVTHEHPDHMGLIGQIERYLDNGASLYLNSSQIAASRQYTADWSIPAMVRDLTPAPDMQPSIVSPGIVMLPAPGHTPGSVMFFVVMRDGRELLFLGDTAWNMSNIRDARGRPRFVQQFLMPEPEDRDAVYNQLAALVNLSRRHQDIVLVPSHDGEHIAALIEDGILNDGYSYTE